MEIFEPVVTVVTGRIEPETQITALGHRFAAPGPALQDLTETPVGILL